MLKKVTIYTHNLENNKILKTSIPTFYLDRYHVKNGVVVGLEFYNSDKRIVDLEMYRKDKYSPNSEFLDVEGFFIGDFEEQLMYEEKYKELMRENPHIIVFASKRDAYFRIREIFPLYNYNINKVSLVNREEPLLKIYKMKIGRDLKRR